MDFPIFNLKELSDGNTYNLTDPADRQKYFKAKLGQKIEDLKSYLDNETFVAYLVAKKNAGKSTIIKMFQEIVGKENVYHIGVGDLVRSTHKSLEDENFKKQLIEDANKSYRGFNKPEELPDIIMGRSQEKLISTDIVLFLLKREIAKLPKKALFIDGLPRDFDQVGVSLFFREIINYRDDPDFFILFQVAESILEARMLDRSVCPVCRAPRTLALGPSKFVIYDKFTDKFKMLCDNPNCVGFGKQELVKKEGDDKGLESIRDRLDQDQKLLEMISELNGVEKVLIRNDIPLSNYKEFVEDYEVTPQYSYEDINGTVKVSTNPWVIKSDDDTDVVSLASPAVAVSMASQIHKILFENNS